MSQEHRLSLTNHELVEVGRRVAWLRRRRGWSQQELAERCRELRPSLFPQKQLSEVPQIRRDRIAKIEMAAVKNGGSTARCLYPHELRLLAAAFEVTESWLRGSNGGETLHLWELSNLGNNARQFAELIAFHEEFSSSRWAWTVPLPCTLQPPAFTEQWLKARVDQWSAYLPCSVSRPSIVDALNTVACANRERTLHRLEQGTLQFFVIMPTETFEALTTGRDLYANISRELRAECLEWAIEKLLRFPEHLKLHLATGDDLAPYRSWTSSFENVYVSGGLMARQDFTGATYFAENETLVQRGREIVQAIYHRATLSHRGKVLNFLRECLATLRRQEKRFRPRGPARFLATARHRRRGRRRAGGAL